MTISSPVAFALEPGRGLPNDTLPAYAPMLAAYHRAFSNELRAMVAALPIRSGDRVLDMACGDGTYSVWLAELVGAHGSVAGVDLSPAYLAQARVRAEASPYRHAISFQLGDINALPFPDNCFDLVWCAQSLFSMPSPFSTLHELSRVVRPGGTVAILENDSIHQLMLPWPVDLELAVRQAQLQSLAVDVGACGKFFIGRHLINVFTAAGLTNCTVTPHAAVRHHPLSDDERCFLEWYLRDLDERARQYLEPAAQAAFRMLVNPNSQLYMLDAPDFYVSFLDLVATGTKATQQDGIVLAFL